MSSTDAAIVLPPKEGFSPAAVGAIGLLAHRLTRAGAAGTVFGAAGRLPPFADVPFVGVRPGLGFTRSTRYGAGLRREIRRLGPRMIEVHNRPEIALMLLGLGLPVSVILNNDPQGMRGAQTPEQRAVLLQRLALVMTCSDWVRRRLLDGVDAPARPVVVLPNCIDVPPPLEGSREKLILFAGRTVRDKGADTFVDVCARVLPLLPGWRAEMIGADRFRADSPDTPFVRRLRPQAEAAGVAMRGHQPNDAVLAAMQRAAIMVVPSRWDEPFGLVALEALACGAALVCSPRGGLPEVAGEAALYADPESADATAEAVLLLARDVGRRAALAAAGRRRAEGFGAAAAAAALLRLRAGMLA